MDESNWRIVILGKTGCGKSSLANTIFGEKIFTTNTTANSETSKCQAETKTISGRSITLIDTPGLFDTDQSEKELKTNLLRCVTECAPGPHAYLIVFKVDKFTEHEEAVIANINQYFSEKIFKYATVLFTHGDQLDEEQTVKEFFQHNEPASNLLKKCGGRCHVIDNKHWKNNQQEEYRSNQFQVKELLKTIDEIIESNEGSCYTNEMLQRVEDVIQKEEELIRQSSGTLTREEVRKEARHRVFKNLMIKLAGIAGGLFFGCFDGTSTMEDDVNEVLKKYQPQPEKSQPSAKHPGAAAEEDQSTFAAAGVVKGGVAESHAAEGAPHNVAEKAKAVRDKLSVFKRHSSKYKTESEPLISEESKKGN